ncbi:YdcH family protein [Amorphus sp. 3PC139-8]|uniref:YdcH family protein n=1 Tax=Amorphus sp. 3PC139-8 TaxID=2735676 RepID=UPI00345D5ABE
MSEENAETPLQELVRLKEEHRDLDAAIEALAGKGVSDQLQIQRLKKRKLQLKDRIHYLQDVLLPDIIA